MPFPYLAAAEGANAAVQAAMALFGGKSDTEKDREDYLWWLGRGITDRQDNPYEKNIGRNAGLIMEGASDQMQGVANTASKRLGLDSGAAWKDIAATRGGIASKVLAELFGQAEELNFRDKQSAMQMLGMLS
jgi:hypothetical protein